MGGGGEEAELSSFVSASSTVIAERKNCILTQFLRSSSPVALLACGSTCFCFFFSLKSVLGRSSTLSGFYQFETPVGWLGGVVFPLALLCMCDMSWLRCVLELASWRL